MHGWLYMLNNFQLKTGYILNIIFNYIIIKIKLLRIWKIKFSWFWRPLSGRKRQDSLKASRRLQKTIVSKIQTKTETYQESNIQRASVNYLSPFPLPSFLPLSLPSFSHFPCIFFLSPSLLPFHPWSLSPCLEISKSQASKS